MKHPKYNQSSKKGNRHMERVDRESVNKSGAIVWTVLALAGAAALAFVVARKIASGESLLDADALLDAADRAANNLDLILSTEGSALS